MARNLFSLSLSLAAIVTPPSSLLAAGNLSKICMKRVSILNFDAMKFTTQMNYHYY